MGVGAASPSPPPNFGHPPVPEPYRMSDASPPTVAEEESYAEGDRRLLGREEEEQGDRRERSPARTAQGTITH